MGPQVVFSHPTANEGSYFNRVRLRTDELPLKPERVVKFTTSEGTRISLDVSPDGRSIVFDLLGDLYVLPIEGGTAQRIVSGMSIDQQPRFSPDGRTIAFASDRTGEVEIWLIDADGGNPRPLRSEGAFGSRPAWKPDGRAISFNSVYRLPTPVRNEEREHGPKIYPLDAGAPEQTAAGGCCDAVFAPDGRYLYSSVLERHDARRIVRVDLQTHAVQTLTSDSQFAFSPLPSRDGRWLVYGQVSGGRVDESSIVLRELSTGHERTLIEQAPGYDAYHANVLPGMAFTPDSRALIVSLEGKFWRVDIPSGKRTLIPFVAEVEQHLGPRVHFDAELEDESIIARHLTNIRMSPDAAKLAFEAALQIYIADRSNDGSVVNYRRLTNLEEVEREPVFSADSRWVVFTTYDDLRQSGYVYKAPVDGSGPPTRLTDLAGVYLSPVMTSDGRGVLVLRGEPAARLGLIWPDRDLKPEIVLKYDLVYLPLNAHGTSREHVIARDIEEGDISVTADGKRAFVLRCVGYVPGATKWPCVTPSSEIDLEQGKVVSTPELADIVPSGWPDFVTRAQIAPDGKQVVVSTRQHVYLTQLVSSNDTKLTAKRIDLEGGDAPAWRADGRIVYSYRNRLYVFDPATGMTERTDLELRLKTDRPSGAVAFTNARLITMRGDEVIERGDILIVDNRVAAIGRHGTINIPREARVIDATGKTILPGYLDLHNHLETGYGTDGLRQRYGTTAALAYGTTTLQYPGNVHDQWEYDATAVGAMLAPRVLSMGRDFDEIGRLDADSIAASVCRYADNFGGVATYKEYHGGNRLWRQHFIAAARRCGVAPTAHNSLSWGPDIAAIIDGYDRMEHWFPTELYDDVVTLVVESGLIPVITPTVRPRRFELDEKFVRFSTPRSRDRLTQGLSAKAASTESSDSTDRDVAIIFPGVKKVLERGGRVALSAHGWQHGPGYHFQMWALAGAGVPNHDVLRVATIHGAHALGLDQQLGSLEVGKLADLQVLEGNPLKNIEDTNTLRYVMKNGRLFDADTLDEVWPQQKKAGPQWWQLPGTAR